MDLTIVIPVLNEEQSVEKVARGCLDASPFICDGTGISRVHVVVVSDGSTDRSAEIARSIEGVDTVVFERNRGYGAAIQAGWAERPSALLAFLDGDGTCDPRFFRELALRLEQRGADIALGSRMSRESRMPRLRRVGNWLFASLLGLLSRQRVTDSASGMRIVRQAALARMLPLPTGLHFTPSKSARAILGGLRIEEVPMPYAEREGRSKLSVARDGLRFLNTILSAALSIRPSRLLLPLVALLAVAALALSVGPTAHYLQHQSLDEGMVYRFLFVALLADVGVAIFCGTLLAEHAIAVGLMHYGAFRDNAPWWWRKRGLNAFLVLSGIALLGGAVLVHPGLVAWLQTGTISPDQMHWSRVVIAAFTGLTFMQFFATRLLVELMHGLEVRQGYLRRGAEGGGAAPAPATEPLRHLSTRPPA